MIGRDVIQDSIGKQIRSDVAELGKHNAELKKLRASYLRYLDLLKAAREKEARIVIAASLLVGSKYEDEMGLLDYLGDYDISTDRVDKKNITLWEAMREIVKHIAEIQVVDLERALRFFGIAVSRAAIESALTTHKDVFRIIRRGREKYVLLKDS